MRRRTPLAWKNLINDPRRLFLATAGVGFASVLMFTQNGFQNALLDSPAALIETLNCELVAFCPARYMLPVNQRFPRHLLRSALAYPEVEGVEALLIERLLARVRVDELPARPIRVISVPDAPGWLEIKGLAEQRNRLEPAGTALVDRKTRKEFGISFDQSGNPSPQSIELANKQLQLVGSFHLGTDFANEGTLLVRENAFADYFPIRGNGQPLEVVDVGLIRLNDSIKNDPDAVDAVGRQLTELAEGMWEVFSPEKLRQRETDFWKGQTPVGKIFFIGTLMGFVVGVIICYQILYTSLQDAMPEFATLKAMGYPNRYFVGLVVWQSIFLSFFGFIPAVIVTQVMFWLLEKFSGLPMLLTPGRLAVVLGLTTAMCLTSGLLALRKLLRADPASLF